MVSEKTLSANVIQAWPLQATPLTSLMNRPFVKHDEATALPLGATGRTIVKFDGVSKIYPARDDSAAVAALDDIYLEIPEGSIVGVIGRSGAGKSTLIRLINGLERPSRGRVYFNGVDIAALDERALRQSRRSIGMIFQHFNLLSSRTAFDNIALPLEIAGYRKDEIVEIVEPLLAMVGLSDKRDRYPSELSGGQKQRVGIARALATKPKVLLSDEATSALDPETTDQILRLLKHIQAELNLSIVLITHEMAVVKTIADRVAVMDNGCIVEQGPTYDIFAHPRHETTKRFVGSVTGSTLPEGLLSRLRQTYQAGDKAVLRVSFSGEEAKQPALSRLSRNYGIDITLLHGQVESVSGQPFGTLFVAMAVSPDVLTKIVDDLQADNHAVEQVGYVS